MPEFNPKNADDVRKVVDDRIKALETLRGSQEAVTVEWRGAPLHLPVISMPTDLLSYNPGTHRIRAQRSLDPALDRELDTDPYGPAAQNYLHTLLMGDPTNPSKVDSAFTLLLEDLRDHGQADPGIITRAGVLINGNTRHAALRELGQKNIRVGVLPPDAGHDDIQSIELSLQLRKDHRRDYSFMNFLLAIDERATSGQLPLDIQNDFRIKASTFDRARWILEFVRDAIERSKVIGSDERQFSLRLIDFEEHQGKLEELYRAYITLKAKSSDDAEALREQRLLALALDKSKTDLRLIEPDFVERYMKGALPVVDAAAGSPVRIPGTSITVRGPSQNVKALRELSTKILQAQSISRAAADATPSQVTAAKTLLSDIDASLGKALDHAGRQGRIQKRRLAAVDRVSDACDDLKLAIEAVAEARSTGNFDASDLDDKLISMRGHLEKLAAIITRGAAVDSEGIAWLRRIAETPGPQQ